MTEYQTEGERRLNRPLAKEKRAGVDHYVTGQHHAEIVEDDTHLYASLSFVNAMGHAVLVLCRKAAEGEWQTHALYGEFGQSHVFAVGAPPGSWVFSEAMLAALAEAVENYERALEAGAEHG
jgi:hypothetical protein